MSVYRTIGPLVLVFSCIGSNSVLGMVKTVRLNLKSLKFGNLLRHKLKVTLTNEDLL